MKMLYRLAIGASLLSGLFGLVLILLGKVEIGLLYILAGMCLTIMAMLKRST